MIILAVDLGVARTGLAICDANEVLSSPAGVLAERDREKLARTVAREALSRCAEGIVIGLPRNMDGSEGESAKNARAFAERLKEIVRIPVAMQDERGTTITAHSYLDETGTYGKKRKAVVDAVAATVILDDFLAYRRNHKQ